MLGGVGSGRDEGWIGAKKAGGSQSPWCCAVRERGGQINQCFWLQVMKASKNPGWLERKGSFIAFDF